MDLNKSFKKFTLQIKCHKAEFHPSRWSACPGYTTTLPALPQEVEKQTSSLGFKCRGVIIINQFCPCFSALSPEHPFQLFTTICQLFLYPPLPKFLLFPLPLCSCPAILPFIHCPPTFVPQQGRPLLFSSALAQARRSTGSLEAPDIPIFLSSDQTYYSCSATRGMQMLAKASPAHAQLLWQRCSCELVPYQSTLVAPLKNTVEKFKLLSLSMLKLSVFRFKNQVLTSSLQAMGALIILKISCVSYIYIHMVIITFIPTHSPVNMGKQYQQFFFFFF